MGPQKRNVEDKQNIFDFSGLWKHAKCGPKQAREFFPANPNLADILREMDFDFENCFGKERLDRAFFTIKNVEKGVRIVHPPLGTQPFSPQRGPPLPL